MLLYGAAPPATEPSLEMVRRPIPVSGAEAAAAAREILDQTVPRWGLDAVGAAASQCLSEVLASLSQTRPDELVLHLVRRPQQLDVELVFAGVDLRLHEELAGDPSRARAIGLVDELATLWGVRPMGDGEVLWFEFHCHTPSSY